jgi:hypothetical protein
MRNDGDLTLEDEIKLGLISIQRADDVPKNPNKKSSEKGKRKSIAKSIQRSPRKANSKRAK